jgi:hypothetical protein
MLRPASPRETTMNTNPVKPIRSAKWPTAGTQPAAEVAHPLRAAMMHALCLLGIGLGGIGALDDVAAGRRG